MKKSLLSLIVILLIVLVDQLIKFEVKTDFLLYETVSVTDWFKLFFTENKGFAFGMSFGGTALLACFRVAAIAACCYLLYLLIKRNAPTGLVICFSMIIAGALGNLIDNAFYGMIFSESLPFGDPAGLVSFGHGYSDFMSGKVVDMFYFPLFTWPEWMPLVGGDVFFGAVFNFADASISCGAVAALLFYGSYYRSLGR